MENTQQPQMPDLNSARHNLGVVTNVMQQHLQSQAPQTPQEQGNSAPQQEQKPQTDNPATPEKKGGAGAVEAKVELNMTDKLDELRKEMKDDMRHEMDGIKSMIEQALTEEDAKEPTEKPA